MQYWDCNEDRQRGTPDFPVEFHHVDKQHPQYVMPFHWHIEYEIIRILKGVFTISLDGTEYTAGKGDVLFIHDGILHAGELGDYLYECIIFDPAAILGERGVFKSYIRKVISHELLIQAYFSKACKPVHHVIWRLFDAMGQRDSGFELVVLGCLYQFFGVVFQQKFFASTALEPPKTHKKIREMKHALEFIEHHYASVVTLEDMAKTTGMSPKYFCRFFKEMTHKTPIEYLNYYRIERACYLLATADASIMEIALDCGFNDLSYFIKTFKAYKGITPGKYIHTNMP